MDKVRVAIRVRPLIQRESHNEATVHWRTDQQTITEINGNKFYIFDRVFGMQETTESVYQEIAKPIVQSAMNGYNGTIFAYGQTSSGKTYTMQGDGNCPGVIGYTIQEIFDTIENTPEREFLLRASYMELYNENITDLLTEGESKPLVVRQTREGKVEVANITEEMVADSTGIMSVIKQGEAKRHVGKTNMNEHSSRSHTIFRIIIESRERSETDQADDCAVKVAELNLVDLAGSERTNETNAEGIRFKEACNINQSLLALSLVIKKLSSGAEHIPFRDSKLTRILESSLGGNAKAAIICTVTPAAVAQTHNTLQFASRAKTITNKPEMNEIVTGDAMLQKCRTEIKELKKRLQTYENQGLQPSGMERIAELEQEKADLQRDYEQKIDQLSKFLVVSKGKSTPRVAKRKVRRETWCPGALKMSLSGDPVASAHLLSLEVAKMSNLPLFTGNSSSQKSDDDVSTPDSAEFVSPQKVVFTENVISHSSLITSPTKRKKRRRGTTVHFMDEVIEENSIDMTINDDGERLREQISSLEQELATKDEAYQELILMLQNLREKVFKLESDLSEKDNDLKQAENEKNSLQQQMQSMEQQFQTKDAEISALKEKFHQSAVSSDVQDLNDKLEESLAICDGLLEEKTAMEDILLKSRDEVQKLSATIVGLEKENNDLRYDYRKMKDLREFECLEIDVWKENEHVLEAKITQLDQDVSKLQQENNEMQYLMETEKRCHQEAVQELRAQLQEAYDDRRKADDGKSEQIISDLENKLQVLKTEYDHVKAELSERIPKHELDAQTACLKQEKDELQFMLETEKERHQTAVQDLRLQLQSVYDENDRCTNATDTKDVSELKKQLQELESKYEIAKADLQESITNAIDVQEDLVETKDQLYNQSLEMEKLSQENKKLSEELKVMKEKHQPIESRESSQDMILNLQAELSVTKEILDKKLEEIHSLTIRIKDYEREVSSLVNESQIEIDRQRDMAIDQYMDAVALLQQEKDALLQKLDKHAETAAEMEKECLIKDEVIEQLKQETSKAFSRVQEFEQMAERTKQEQMVKEKKIQEQMLQMVQDSTPQQMDVEPSAPDDEKQNLTHRLQELEEKVCKMEETCAQKEEIIQKLRAEATDTFSKLQMSSERLAHLEGVENEKKTLEVELETLKESRSLLQSQFAEMCVKVSLAQDVSEEKAILEKEISVLNEIISAAQKENEELCEKLNQSEKAVQESKMLEDELKALKESQTVPQSQREELCEKLAQLEKLAEENQALEAELATLKESHALAQSQKDEFSEKLTQLEKVTEEKKILEAELAALKESKAIAQSQDEELCEMLTKLEEVQGEKRVLEDELTSLKESLTLSESQVKELCEKLTQFERVEEEKKALEAELTVLKKSQTFAQNQNEELSEKLIRLDEMEKEKKTLEDELTALKESLNLTQCQNEELSEKLTDLEKVAEGKAVLEDELTTLKGSKKLTQSQHEEMSHRLHHLEDVEKEKEVLEQEIGVIRESFLSSQRRYEELSERLLQMEHVETEKKTLEEEMKVLRESSSSLERKLEEMSERLIYLEKIEEEKGNLENELGNLKENILTSGKDNEELSRRVDHLESIEEEKNSLQQEVALLKEYLSQNEDEKQANEKKCEEYEEEIKELEFAFKDAENQIQRLSNVVEELEEELKQEQEDHESSKEQLRLVQDEKQASEMKCADYETDVAELKFLVSDAENQMQRLSNIIEELEEELNEEQKQHESSKKQLDLLQEKVNGSHSGSGPENETNDREVQKLSIQCSSASAELKESKEKITQLQEDLKKTKLQLEESKKELSNAKNGQGAYDMTPVESDLVCKDLQKRLEVMTRKEQHARKMWDRNTKMLDEMEGKLEQKTKEIKQLKVKLEQVQKQLSSHKEEDHTTKLMELEQQISTLTSEKTSLLEELKSRQTDSFTCDSEFEGDSGIIKSRGVHTLRAQVFMLEQDLKKAQKSLQHEKELTSKLNKKAAYWKSQCSMIVEDPSKATLLRKKEAPPFALKYSNIPLSTESLPTKRRIEHVDVENVPSPSKKQDKKDLPWLESKEDLNEESVKCNQQ